MPDNKKVGMGSNMDKSNTKTAGRDVAQGAKNASPANTTQSNTGFSSKDKSTVSSSSAKKSSKDIDADEDLG